MKCKHCSNDVTTTIDRLCNACHNNAYHAPKEVGGGTSSQCEKLPDLFDKHGKLSEPPKNSLDSIMASSVNMSITAGQYNTINGPDTGSVMTLRQYAAIHLRVPDSGNIELDQMIRDSKGLMPTCSP